MLKQIKKILSKANPKSEFSRNALVLLIGSSIAQVVPIAISPLVSRLYTPKDFGIFAIYVSMVSILSILATGRYELSLVIQKTDKDAVNILALLLAIVVLFSFILVVFVSIIDVLFDTNANMVGAYIYFLPISVFFVGIYQSFQYWNTRSKKYKVIAGSRISRSLGASSTSIILGNICNSAFGLVLGNVIGQLLAVIVILMKTVPGMLELLPRINLSQIIFLAKRYKNFPKMSMPHALLNSSSSNLPVLILTYYFSESITGYYSFANMILLAPVGIITNSYSQVFLQQVAKIKNECEPIYVYNYVKKMIFKLMLYSLPVLVVGIFILPDMFPFIFGEKWRQSGVYSTILLPMIYFRFTGAIISSVAIVYEAQRKALFLEIINILARIASIIFGGVQSDALLGFILFSGVSSLMTSYRIYWYLQIIKNEV